MKNILVSIVFSMLFSALVWAQTSPAEMEQAILNELNAVRADPQSYIARLEEYKKSFDGKKVKLDGRLFQTYDGIEAVDDALKFLKKAARIEPFKTSDGLTKTAQLQLADLKQNISLGIVGKDGSTIPQRAAKFGKGGKLFAANIGLYSATAEDIVLNMIIDDGVKGRGNRKNIFNKSLQYIGIAFGRGKNDDPITLIVFADKFTEKTE